MPRRLHEQAGPRAVAEATGRPVLMVAGLLLALEESGGVEVPGDVANDLARTVGDTPAFWACCVEQGLVISDGTRAYAALPRGKNEPARARERDRARERQRSRRSRLLGAAAPPPPAVSEAVAPVATPAPKYVPPPVPEHGPPQHPVDLFGNAIGGNEAARDPHFPHPLFPEFWAAYPRKESKKDALKAFNKIDPNRGELEVMLASIAVYKQTDGWRRGIIPHPATWLRANRWEDQPGPGGGRNGLGRDSRVEAEHDGYDGIGRVVEM